MVAIKRKLLHSVNSLIVLLISLLGFTTSCEKDEPLLMYGTPHATFIVKGKVTSLSDNKPVKDIIIEIRSLSENEDPSQSMLVETGFSRYLGDYTVGVYGDPHDQTYKVRFVDTDGALNGEYQTLDTTVVFKDPKFVNGDGSWYRGYVEKTLDVKLKPKE